MPLSIFRDGRPPAVTVASPVFFTSPTDSLQIGAEITFEVSERDASALKPLVGKDEYYVINFETHFWARLKILEPCKSTHPGLALLRDRPTLRGVLTVFKETAAKQ